MELKSGDLLECVLFIEVQDAFVKMRQAQLAKTAGFVDAQEPLAIKPIHALKDIRMNLLCRY